MISQKTVQEIIETAKIEEVVGDFVSLKRAGVNLKGLCPFHNEKTPSFVVSPSKNLCKCFGCGKGGDPIQFIREHENMSYPEALRFLANKYGIKVEETETSEEQRQERQLADSLYIVNEFALKHFQEQLLETDYGKSIGLGYFKERGFRQEIIKKFGLGFTPNTRQDFKTKALNAGYKEEHLSKLGLVSKAGNDFFRNRVMFTIHSLTGKVVGFAGRILVKGTKAPKYLNSPESEIYNKSKTLYGAYFAKTAIRKNDECIMVEGYTDVLSLHQAGIEHVVASSGTSLTEGQIRLIKRYTPNMKFIYDGDAAGIKAALRGLDLVLEQDMNVKVVLLPEGEDPDSYLKKVGTTVFKEYIDKEAKDFILFKTQLLLEEAAGDPIKKANLIKDIVESIAKIPDPIKRSVFVKECSTVMDVEEQILVNEVNKIFNRNIQKKRLQKSAKINQSLQALAEDVQGIEVPFPTEEEFSTKTIVSKPSRSGNEFQEKDIIRLLLEFGEELMDKEEALTVAHYILANVEEVVEDFENPVYKKIALECYELLGQEKAVARQHFIQHQDEEIKQTTLNLLSSPYEYSPNWEKIHDQPLQTQKKPEDNFINDTLSSVNRFKLKSIIKLCAQNQERIKEAFSEGDEIKGFQLMKVQQVLNEKRKIMAEQLGGTVVLK